MHKGIVGGSGRAMPSCWIWPQGDQRAVRSGGRRGRPRVGCRGAASVHRRGDLQEVLWILPLSLTPKHMYYKQHSELRSVQASLSFPTSFQIRQFS